MAGKNKSKLGKNILVKHGVDKLISMINIEYNIETNVYTLSVNSPEAKLSAEIANIYLDELVTYWKNILELIPSKFKKDNKLKKSGIAGLLSAALELSREGLIKIMQKKDFDKLLIKERND